MLLALCGLGARDGLAQGAMVRGQVVDERGRPLAGVKVELQYLGKERQTFARSTNEKGGFVQVGLPSGPYTIQYTREGYLPLTTRTTITAGGLNEIPTETLKVAPKAAVAPPAAQGPGPEADVAKGIQETYAKAMEAASAGRLDESTALFKQILEATPDLAVARYNLGYIYSRKKDWPAAEAEFRRVIELQPERSDTYSALAVVYEATGRRREAVEVLSAASPRFERDAAFQYSAGIVYLNGGETALAEAALLKARDLDPSKVEAHYYLATLAVGGGRVEEAAAHLQTYLSLSGQNPQNLETARRLLEALKKPAKP
jgi:thioredoxin-like negative regulator of GroEL